MIPTNPEDIKKLEELAARNVANGDWGDEVRLPNEGFPTSPAETSGAAALLEKVGKTKLPKK